MVVASVVFALAISVAAWWWSKKIRFPGLFAALALSILSTASFVLGLYMIATFDFLITLPADEKDALVVFANNKVTLDYGFALLGILLIAPFHILAVRNSAPTSGAVAAWVTSGILSLLCVFPGVYLLLNGWSYFSAIDGLIAGNTVNAVQVTTALYKLSGIGMVGVLLAVGVMLAAGLAGVVLLVRAKRADQVATEA
ncbi:MAG: hypothetical protein HN348_24970 [Proteobacteria bacterium]|jgi:hypothetical protein|nr:hypothetical protein [Pseudomonadota bacterium]